MAPTSVMKWLQRRWRKRPPHRRAREVIAGGESTAPARATETDPDASGAGSEEIDTLRAMLGLIRENDPCLTMVDLGFCGIGDGGAADLADALRSNSTVRALILGWNNIGDEGAKILADALRRNASVVNLDLSRNIIGDEGMVAVAKMLRHNGTIRRLSLQGNCITDEGAKVLAHSLYLNSAIFCLDITSNHISSKGANSLACAVRSLQRDNISDSEAGCFARNIVENSSCIPFDLEGAAIFLKHAATEKNAGGELELYISLPMRIGLHIKRPGQQKLLAAVFNVGLQHVVQEYSLAKEHITPMLLKRAGTITGLPGLYEIVRARPHLF